LISLSILKGNVGHGEEDNTQKYESLLKSKPFSRMLVFGEKGQLMDKSF
jgi:hypothetical protein